MANYIVRATKDTTSQIGGAPSIIIGILGTLAGIGMQGWREGISAVSANIPTVLYGFAGLGLSAVLLFLYNLILAPFRCEREARLAIDDELKATQNRVAKLEQLKPNFVIEIEQVLFGETENADPRFLQCVVWVTIKNRGTPSIADRWSIYLQKGDQRSVGRICRLSGTMTFPNEVGHVVHEPSDAIENRTTDAIASGAMEQGYIAFSVSRDEVGNDLKGWTIFVTAQDIYGQEHVGQRESVGGGGRHNLMTRVPGKIIARENI